MSENISEIDQTEFDNVPASVPVEMHDHTVLTEDIVEQTEIEPTHQSTETETVDITEPIIDDQPINQSIEQPSESESESVSSSSSAPRSRSDSVTVVHDVDSQEARNAMLLAAETAEDKQDEVEEINTELAAAEAAERKRKQQEALLAAIQQALAGTSGQSMEMFGLGGDGYDDYEDDEQDQPEEPVDTSMFAWLKSNLLPSAPISSYFTARSLQRYSRVYGLKAGRLAWNIGAAGLLLLVPYIIAHANELSFVDQFRENNRLQELVHDAQTKGYDGLSSLAFNQTGQSIQQTAHVPAKAPAGYAAPPAVVAGIPSQ